jgi:GABA permease
MWLYPYLTWATIGLILFVLAYMLTDTEHGNREILLLSLLVAAVVVGISLVKEKIKGQKAGATPEVTDKVG